MGNKKYRTLFQSRRKKKSRPNFGLLALLSICCITGPLIIVLVTFKATARWPALDQWLKWLVQFLNENGLHVIIFLMIAGIVTWILAWFHNDELNE